MPALHRLLLAFVSLAGFGLAAGTAASQGCPPLWDGETFHGWEEIGEGDWSIVDGAIRGTHDAEVEPYGHLVTEAVYSDFDARFDFKSVEGNSGFYFRIGLGGFSGVTGFQAEVDPRNDVGGLYETNGRQWVVQPAPELVRAWNRPGEWNRMTVSADGPLIRVTLNGHTTALIYDPESRSQGHIALQVHGGQDVEVWFRDLEISCDR